MKNLQKNNFHKYPLVWRKEDFFIKIYASIPNIATGIIITTDKSTFAVDPGDGFLRDLNKDLGPKRILDISDIFISHGHHDHIGGFWSLFTYLSVMKRKKPLKLHYPEGCIEIESIYKAFKNVNKSGGLSFKIILNPIKTSALIRRNDVSIKPFRVNHRELAEDGNSSREVPSLGFKFIYKGKSICYGGDTAYCESLVKMSKGADLAIIEAGAEGNAISDDHMTIGQAKKIGNTAKEYFLVHIPE